MTINPFKTLIGKLPPLPATPPTHAPHRSSLIQLALLILIAVLLHFKIADLKIASFAILVFGIKAIIIFRNLKPPPKLVMVILTVVSLGLVLYVYGGWNGQTAGISFLVLLVALKFLESNALRDYFVVCLLLYFLAASSFLFDSSIISIAIIVIYTLGITSILLQISNPTKISYKQTLKSSFGMVFKALPLAALLFFFFPRISGDFGFLPSQDRNNIDGLSDTLIAGEMASSAFNHELAFRVQFEDGVTPPRDQLYWRAKTMTNEINFAWEVNQPEAPSTPALKLINDAADLAQGDWFYKILHESTSDNFIPYLDYVAGASLGTILRDYSVTLRRQTSGSFSYQGSASSKQLLSQGVGQITSQLLVTSSEPTARLEAVLTSIRNKANNDSEAIALLYQYFLDRPFNYSLEPPGLDEFTPLDDFIFNTRTGYCEHYASAFTTLARWLRIPARVVVGYQGGTEVGAGNFLEIRYSDAHAWSEVWLDGKWVRVDATAAVSPERIEYGMEVFRELMGLDQNDRNSRFALSNIVNPTGATKFLRTLQDSWKNVGYQWKKWVVDYNFDTQRELLENLGFKHKNSVLTLVLIMTLGALITMLLYFWQLVPRRIKRNELQVTYLNFVNKFKSHGLEKNLSDTPESFAAKARGKFPKRAEKINEISKQFQVLRYGLSTGDNKPQFDSFKRNVKQFKLSSK